MTKPYGRGTISEIVKVKKYRLALSSGKDPMSGLVYKTPGKVPDDAFAIGDGKQPVIKRHYEGLNYHELRHTHFTMRLASGMDIPTAQALGGWSTPAMLMNVYAHPVNENIWNAAGFMDKLTKANQSEEAYRSDQQSPSSDILSAAKQGKRTA